MLDMTELDLEKIWKMVKKTRMSFLSQDTQAPSESSKDGNPLLLTNGLGLLAVAMHASTVCCKLIRINSEWLLISVFRRSLYILTQIAMKTKHYCLIGLFKKISTA